MKINGDRVRGVLYGQAVGDSLGLPAEFKSSRAIRSKWPDPTWPSNYEPTPRLGSAWKAGEFSDDTEQAVCILDAYFEGRERGLSHLDPVILAEKFMRWAATNGRGMGNHTAKVFESTMFLLDPHAVAEEVWEASGRHAAPNGAVMRTSYVGILRPWDLDWTEQTAVSAAKTTHADPRCVASAVAVSIAIATLCDTDGDIDEALNQSTRRASKYHEEAAAWMAERSLSSLLLDEDMDKPRGTKFPPIGYTYKCLGAGFWALHQWRRCPEGDSTATRFLDVLRAVIRAGGDADTNGAVVGAMLGAVAGEKGLPYHLINGLYAREELDQRGLLLDAPQ